MKTVRHHLVGDNAAIFGLTFYVMLWLVFGRGDADNLASFVGGLFVLHARITLKSGGLLKRTPLRCTGSHARRNGVGIPKHVDPDIFEAVAARSGYRCVVCGTWCPDAPPHHVLPKSLYPHLADDPDVMVLVCLPCHDNHERAFRRIPYAALPKCVVELVQREGPRAVAYLERTYPDKLTHERY